MKINSKNENTESNFKSEEIGFEIGNQDIVLGILFDKLYADKILVPVQEYLSNARDAMREAQNKTDKVDVTLPTEKNPVFKVRDYGPGLSDERVRSVFVKTGNSTKRNSNLQTGGFGIGAKSGFAYSGNFIVTSFFEGKKTEYLADISEVKSGTLKVLNVSDTIEKNGVEIQIPVNVDDISRFEEAVFKTTAFWGEERPNIKNLPAVSPQSFKTWRRLYENISQTIYKNTRTAIFKEKGAFSYDLVSNFKVVVDGIIYPLPSSPELKEQLEVYTRTVNFYDKNTYFFASVGELEISASRETLQASQQTINALKKVVEEARLEFVADFTAEVEKVNTLSEARIVVDKFRQLVAKSQNALGKKIVEGIPLNLSNGQIEHKALKVCRVRFGWRNIRYRLEVLPPSFAANEIIYCDKDIAEATANSKISSLAKARLAGQKGTLNVLLIPFQEKEIATKLSAKNLTDVCPKREKTERKEKEVLAKGQFRAKYLNGLAIAERVFDLNQGATTYILVEENLKNLSPLMALFEHLKVDAELVSVSKKTEKELGQKVMKFSDLNQKLPLLLGPENTDNLKSSFERLIVQNLGFAGPVLSFAKNADLFEDPALKEGFKKTALYFEPLPRGYSVTYGLYLDVYRLQNLEMFKSFKENAERLIPEAQAFQGYVTENYPLLTESVYHFEEKIFYANLKYQKTKK